MFSRNMESYIHGTFSYSSNAEISYLYDFHDCVKPGPKLGLEKMNGNYA